MPSKYCISSPNSHEDYSPNENMFWKAQEREGMKKEKGNVSKYTWVKIVKGVFK